MRGDDTGKGPDLHAVQKITVRILLIITGWVVLVLVVGLARHFLFLILLAWLSAIAAEPAIRWLIRHRWKRGLATAAVGGSVLVIAVVTLALFGTSMFQQLSQLVQGAPAVVEQVARQLNSSFGLELNPQEIASKLQLTSDQVQDLAGTYGAGVLGAVESLGSVLIDLLTVVVFAFYIAGAGPRLVQRLAVWMPPDRQLVFGELWEMATQKTGGFVASKVILSALSTAFHAVFFWAIGLPGWLPLALLAGITAQFIPIVGTYIGVLIPGIVALADKPINALWIVLFAVVYQQIESYVFTPRVAEKTMDVNPAVALAAVFLGVAIWGPIGAVIGVPITAVVVAILDTYGPRHRLVPELTGDDETLAAAVDSRQDDDPDDGRSTDPGGAGERGSSNPTADRITQCPPHSVAGVATRCSPRGSTVRHSRPVATARGLSQ